MVGIEYKTNRVRIGDNFAKIYTVMRYPQSVGVGWLSKISNIPNTISSYSFEPTDNMMLIQNISKGIRQNEAILDSITDAIQRQRTEREIEDGEELIKRIDQNRRNSRIYDNTYYGSSRNGGGTVKKM